jgi:hypothetical protein
MASWGSCLRAVSAASISVVRSRDGPTLVRGWPLWSVSPVSELLRVRPQAEGGDLPANAEAPRPPDGSDQIGRPYLADARQAAGEALARSWTWRASSASVSALYKKAES